MSFNTSKNLETPTKMDRVAGIRALGPACFRCLYMKARYLHRRHPGHGLIAATGTPVGNSLCEMYTLQRYLDPEGLKSRGIDHFDAWAATFGEIVDTMEISPDGKTLKPRSRFARFVNAELQQMFRASPTRADGRDAEPAPACPETGSIVVACLPMSEEHALTSDDWCRYDRLRAEGRPRVDNALAITTDGHQLALDARMVSGAKGGPVPGSKMEAMLGRVR